MYRDNYMLYVCIIIYYYHCYYYYYYYYYYYHLSLFALFQGEEPKRGLGYIIYIYIYINIIAEPTNSSIVHVIVEPTKC